MRYIPKLLRLPVLIGLAAAGSMVTSTLPAAAGTAADTQPPTGPYIHLIGPLHQAAPGGCKVFFQILESTDNVTPQNEIRYQVFSNGVPIPGQLLLARPYGAMRGLGAFIAVVQPAPTAQRFTLEAVDQAGNYSQPSSPLSRTISGPPC